MKIFSTFLFLALSFSLLLGQVPYNQEFRVNSSSMNDQQNASICSLLNDKFVICWNSWSPDINQYDVYGQIFNSDGSNYGNEFQVNTYTLNSQVLPSITAISNEQFVICWQSEGQDGDKDGIYAQIFNNNGDKYGQEFQVNTDTRNYQSEPKVYANYNDKFLICWYSDQDYGWDTGVYYQFFNYDGSLFGGEHRINTYRHSSQNSPDVCSLSDGKFVVCWTSWGQDGSSAGIYAEILNNNGSRNGDEFLVNTYTENWQWNPCISRIANDKFIICWESGDQNGLYAQIFNNNGLKIGDEFRVNSNKNYYHREPKISNLTNGKFVVTWYCLSQNGEGHKIYGQIFNPDGSKYGTEFNIDSNSNHDQYSPNICSLPGERFAVCWQSDGQHGDGWDIYAKYYLNELVHPLQVFTLYKPLYNKTKNLTTLEWQKASLLRINFPFELKYEIYLDEEEEFNSPQLFSEIYDTTFILNSTESGENYYWKVLAKNIDGDSFWSSEVGSFPQINPVQLFSLIEPRYDATIENTALTFNWYKANTIQMEFPWEVEYLIFLDEDDNFSSPRIISAIYDTTCVVDSLVPGATYFWKVLAKNIAGDSLWSNETNGFFVSHDATALEKENHETPKSFELFQNYPNPFNPTTVISYRLTVSSEVTLMVYDSGGREIVTLVNGSQTAGEHKVTFDASGLSSGVYFCVVQAGQFKAAQKMLLIR